MNRLYVEGDHGGVPGLLCAPSPAELEEVCRRQAAKLVRPAVQTPRRVFLYPTMDFDHIRRGTDLIIGGNHSSAGVLAALSAGAAVLAISTHSDGIDVTLSSRQFGCPFLTPSTMPEPLPQCQVVGRCTRFPAWPTIMDAQKSGRIVPLSGIRADICILLSCSILRLPDGIINPGHALAAALLQQADLGVLVTTWRRERLIQDGACLNGMINALCSGEAVGSVVRSFNDSSLAGELGIKLCVIGDPRFRVHIAATFNQLPEARGTSPIAVRPSSTATRQSNGEITLLRSAIEQTIRTKSVFDMAKARLLLRGLEQLANPSLPGHPIAWNVANLDSVLLDFLCAAPQLHSFFSGLGKEEEIDERDVCPCCLEPARGSMLTFPTHGAEPRRLVRCAVCADSLNVPRGWQFALDLGQFGNRMIALSGVPQGAQARVSFVALADSIGPMRSRIFETHLVDPSQRRQLTYRIPDQLPPVPLYCRILVAHRLKIGLISFKIRQLSDGTLISHRAAQ
jgi:hypothetical protein